MSDYTLGKNMWSKAILCSCRVVPFQWYQVNAYVCKVICCSVSIKRLVLSDSKQAVTDTDALLLHNCFGLKARSFESVCKINHEVCLWSSSWH